MALSSTNRVLNLAADTSRNEEEHVRWIPVTWTAEITYLEFTEQGRESDVNAASFAQFRHDGQKIGDKTLVKCILTHPLRPKLEAWRWFTNPKCQRKGARSIGHAKGEPLC